MTKFLALAALLSAAALPAAQAQTSPTTQLRPVAHFRGIRVGGGIRLTLAAGHEQRVEVSAATPDFAANIRTKLEDGILIISYDDLLERDDRKLLKTDHQLRATITADFLTSLAATSEATVQASGNFAAPDCVLDVTSGAKLTATGLAPEVLVVRENGGAVVTLAGTAPRLDVRVNGGSTYEGQQLQSVRGQVEANGNSTARIAASQELLIEANSGSKVNYYGSPVVSRDLNGGSISSAK
ncbi:MAG: GIN domain-containing protein [Janthinobacterium lividum]